MIKIDKLFRDKGKNSVIYIIVAIGILLIFLGNTGKTVPESTEAERADSRTREAELILSEIKGAGCVRVMISEEKKEDESVFSDEKDINAADTSVLIVADGGDDSRVREKIIRAASAALGVESHKIQVFERKD